MKKLFLILMIAGIGVCSFAQDAQIDPEVAAKIESHRVAFITEKLELTPEEAQQFWPIFNQMVEERRALKKQFRVKKKDLDSMSDQELEKALFQDIELDEKELAMKRRYILEFKKVLPIKKVVKLALADRAFKRAMLDKVKGKGKRDRR